MCFFPIFFTKKIYCVRIINMKQDVAKVIILIGQSNAVGVGWVKYLPDHFSAKKVKEYLTPYENLQINFYSHDFGIDNFIPTKINCAELTKDTLGPEIGMAATLKYRFKGETFYLVKYAVGGTALYKDWLSPTTIKKEKVTPDGEKEVGWCYKGFLKKLDQSIDILENQGKKVEIRAICFMQGENDACCLETANHYGERFSWLVKDFESAYKKYLVNHVWAIGGISSFEQWVYYKKINRSKKEYCKNTPNAVYIDTIKHKLSTLREPVGEVDKPHYDVNSIIKLGNLFIKAIEKNLK